MLAQRISSINSLTGLTESVDGCNIKEVKEIIQSDSRIGSKYLNPSPGFGGSCFEKDLQSLIFILHENGEHIPAQYWQGVLDINNYQKQRLANIVSNDMKVNKIVKPKVCIFGFSYKQNTSDTRLSQSAFVVNHLASNMGY